MGVQVLLVEHDDVGGLYPFTATHCSWELRIGVCTILERWQRAVPMCSVTVASHRELCIRSFVERYSTTAPYQIVPTLIVAGNLFVSPDTMRQMVGVCSTSNQAIAFFCNNEVVAAYIPNAPSSPDAAVVLLDACTTENIRRIEVPGKIIARLWQVLDHIGDGILWDAHSIQNVVDDEAVVHSSTVIDERNGPVVIQEHATIEPFCYLEGPLVIGNNSTVRTHSTIRSSIIGPVCKVSGEITHTVMQGYSNKQHDGFVGHTFIGEWCNLGAGTTTSNLKNTYGNVRVHMPWFEEDTGRVFLGSLLADYVSTGIGTMLGTGFLVGTGCSITQLPRNASSLSAFSWVLDNNTVPYEFDKFISVTKTVMGRRSKHLGPHTETLLRSLHKQEHG